MLSPLTIACSQNLFFSVRSVSSVAKDCFFMLRFLVISVSDWLWVSNMYHKLIYKGKR